jgi:Tol biopolymer transport system component/DNA-binding winged helix-turn-helix (wHTH) protein
METISRLEHHVRFDTFELDLLTRELHRNGQRIKLRGHPIDVLDVLLERPGELVTREELRKRLWPDDTFVDFEQILNNSIVKLRDALGDRAEAPRFIETLPRLGYRFICPVVNEEFSASSQVSEGVPILDAVGPVQQTVVAEAKQRGWLHRWRWPLILVAGLSAAIGIPLVWLAWFSAPPALVVTSIEPLTNDGLTKYNLLTDGSRLYFVERAQERFLLSQVSAVGGEISRIASPVPNTLLHDVSPDGSKLLVSDTDGFLQPFWVVPLPSGTPRRLGALEGHNAAWSPDGKQIVFHRSSEIWTADSEGANSKKILATSSYIWRVRVSPDGRHIRYTDMSRNPSELWESNSDGSAAHALLPGWHSPLPHFGGMWSPDGRYYAFLEGDLRVANIWVLPETSSRWSHRNSTPVQLTRGPINFYSLSFDPGGRTLFAVGTMRRGELVRYDPGTHQVSPYLSGVSAGILAFSRDAQWIAYVTYPDLILWRCRIDGSDRQQLTTTGGAFLPQWSPDGRKIAFVKGEFGKPARITIIPMDGGKEEEATDQKELNENDANWSPDGTRMIYGICSIAVPGSCEIRELDLRTRKITSIPGSKGLYSPRWSPDGRYLAALSEDSHRLMLFDFEKQLWTTWITAEDVNTVSVAYPVWSRDGRYLYFGSLASRGAGDMGEWRMRPGQHLAERILDLHYETRFQGPGNFWSTVGPDGGVYFTRDRSSTEIYALHLGEK